MSPSIARAKPMSEQEKRDEIEIMFQAAERWVASIERMTGHAEIETRYALLLACDRASELRWRKAQRRSGRTGV